MPSVTFDSHDFLHPRWRVLSDRGRAIHFASACRAVMNDDPRLTEIDIELIKHATNSNRQRLKELVDFALWDDLGDGTYLLRDFQKYDRGNALQRGNAQRQRDRRAKERAEQHAGSGEQSRATRGTDGAPERPA